MNLLFVSKYELAIDNDIEPIEGNNRDETNFSMSAKDRERDLKFNSC